MPQNEGPVPLSISYHQFRYLYSNAFQIHVLKCWRRWNSLLNCLLSNNCFYWLWFKNIQKSDFFVLLQKVQYTVAYTKPCLSLSVLHWLHSFLLRITEISFLSELLNNPSSIIHLGNDVLIMQPESTTPSTGPYYIHNHVLMTEWLID